MNQVFREMIQVIWVDQNIRQHHAWRINVIQLWLHAEDAQHFDKHVTEEWVNGPVENGWFGVL